MKAIDFELINTEGKLVKLSDYIGNKVVLFFYPKANTSGCTQEALMFKEEYNNFKKLGIEILGISKDEVKLNKKFKEDNELPYDLLSDTETTVCKAYDVYKEKSMYGRKYMGIVRTTIIINESQEIIKRYDNVKIKGHTEEIIKFLK